MYCKYHGSEPALWYCAHCDIHFCHRCVPLRDSVSKPKCTLCCRDLTPMTISESVTPFWHQLNFFFLYPLHGSVITFYLLCAMLTMFFVPSVVFYVILFAVFSALMRFLFGLTERISEGVLEPPNFGDCLRLGSRDISIKVIFLALLLVSLLTGTKSLLPELLWVLLYLAVMICIPAALMLLAIEQKVLSAINPGKLGFIIRAIGWRYGILLGFVLMLNISTNGVIAYFEPVLPRFLLLPTILLVFSYFSVILFAMLGYVLYQYHHELGLAIDHSIVVKNLMSGRDEGSAVRQKIDDPDIIESEILIKEGRFGDAITRLEALIKRNPSHLKAREKLHQLMKVTHDHEGLERTATAYIKVLIKAQKPELAGRVYNDLLGVNNRFEFADPELCYQLARGVAQSRHAHLAVKVCHNLHKRFPQYKKIAVAYLLVAKVYAERLQDDEKAKTLLRFAQSNYPDSAASNAIDEYLRLLEKIDKSG